MSEFTVEELTLITEVYRSAGAYGYGDIAVDVDQGVFTQAMIDEMVAEAPASAYPRFAQHITDLAALLDAGGQVIGTPAGFTADEMAQMAILSHNGHAGVVQDVMAAEHVGFWSVGTLADLYSYVYDGSAYQGGLGPNAQAAVQQLVSDLEAGGQVVPDAPLIGMHHHHHHHH